MGPMGGPGPGPMGGPGPGQMRMHGPPGSHNMGLPRPGFMQGPGPMSGPPDNMYGIDPYKDMEEAPEKIEDKPKAVYASAAVITVPRKVKEKKKKKKKEGSAEGTKSDKDSKLLLVI